MPIKVIKFIVYGIFLPMDDEYTANMLLCLNENCRQNSFIYSITPNNIVVVTVVLVLGFIQYM